MTEVLKVMGMNCGHCKQSVEKAIQSVGAHGTVDLAQGIVVIDFDPTTINLQNIILAIEDQGYDVAKE